jgi:membrane protease YdiL (CAAX protease family)
VSTWVVLSLTLAVLIAVNGWVHVGARRTHLWTGPAAAAVLILLGRAAGLSWSDLGLAPADLRAGAVYAVAAAAVIACVYLVGVAVPRTRPAFLDTRYRVGPRGALFAAFVTVPVATVLVEEVAFRGVLWGLVAEEWSPTTATATTAVLFGLWHVLPALALVRTHTAVAGGSAPDRRRTVLTVVGTVAFTTAAGVVFAEMRRRSGSVVAPMGLHWATNGLGVLAAAWAWSLSPRGRPER